MRGRRGKLEERRALVEEETLRTILNQPEDCVVESPLWRGRSPMAYPNLEDHPPSDRLAAEDSSQVVNHDPAIYGVLSEVEAVRKQVHAFRFPDQILFSRPPATPTDMYPAGGWESGPVQLDPRVRSNASILLYVRYLASVKKRIRKAPESNLELKRLLDDELCRLESFREAQWERLRLETKDPGNLRTPSSGIWFNSSEFNLLLPVGLFTTT
jgi:hypothetical protein